MFCAQCGAPMRNSARPCASCGYRAPDRRGRGNILLAAAAVLLLGVSAVGAFATLSGGLTVSVAGQAMPANPTPPPSAAREGESPDPALGADVDFGTVFARVSSGVVPVTTVACGRGGTGSAFLIDERTLVTAAHLVNQAVSVSAQVDGTPRTAEVVGIDESADLAVLEIGEVASGTALAFAEADAQIGDAVAALGYPDGTALRLTEGHVLHVDQTVDVEGDLRHEVVESQVTARPGNSGGPLINVDGDVVGVVIARPEDGSRTIAVEASTVRSRISAMAPPSDISCEQPPLGPDDPDGTDFPDTTTLTDGVAATFAAYFAGINTGDYASAYDQLSPRLASPGGFDPFAEGVSTSYDFAFDVRAADLNDDTAHVWLEFVSLQDPAYGPDGEPCTQWSLDYQLVRGADNRFLIDHVTGHHGAPPHRPCD